MEKYINQIVAIDTILSNPPDAHYPVQFAEQIGNLPAADVALVRHGSCEVCRGESVITQDCDTGYSIEVDAEQSELSVWYGDKCLAVFSIDFCPNCGAKMDGGKE